MNKHNQDGAINILLLPLIVAVVLLLGSLAFGYWAYGSRQDYKNNTDQKINTAVTLAQQQESTIKDKQFAEQSKDPLATYNGPQQFGSLFVRYPKTWSSYVDSTSSSQTYDAYFNPATVPSTNDPNNNFALRLQVLQQAYSDTLQSFADQAGITVTPYSLPNVPKVIGVRIQGAITDSKNGDMIVLPLRGSTLEIYTEDSRYENDFTKSVLPNISFSP